jgi:hypothetical protein
MSSPFEFAPGVSNTAQLDANNEGLAAFTVTNVAGRRIRAIAHI